MNDCFRKGGYYMNKFEIIRFAIKSNDKILVKGRFDCINGNFDTKEAKEFMRFYKISYSS